MSSLWTNLLFMHGHIADPELARRLADTSEADARPTGKRQPIAKAQGVAKKGIVMPAVVTQGGCLTS
ncbi:hypothetical protein [Dyella sp. 20L07]|uniref:hypothetical protein n=1 Tax=Dyella sp. 20L07 TaxID=3384240 RepID=UPI003D287E12